MEESGGQLDLLPCSIELFLSCLLILLINSCARFRWGRLININIVDTGHEIASVSSVAPEVHPRLIVDTGHLSLF